MPSLEVMIDKFASEKLRLISFLAMCAVVSWHIDVASSVVKRWLCPIACFWSVPWFFFASGVFFVFSIQKKSWVSFAVGKIQSLVIPYVMWCLAGFFFKFMILGDAPFDVCAVFALDRLHPVGNGPMWYIRVLMLLFILSVPIWVLCAKTLKGICLKLLFSTVLLITLGILKMCGINLHLGPGSSVCYFLCGVVLSDYIVRFPMIPLLNTRRRLCTGVILLIVSMCVRGVWFVMGYDYYKMGGTMIANVSVVVFLIAVLLLLDSEDIISRASRHFGWLMRHSVFVYMSHHIFLGMMVSFAIMYGFSQDVVYVVFSLLMPFLFAFLGQMVRIGSPRIYFTLTGHRG